MAKVDGLGRLIETLNARMRKQPLNIAFAVGFRSEYAIFVHENLEAHHPTGQAKYLEQPARTMRKELAAQIAREMKSGLPIEGCLLRAGLRLMRAAQALVPVDTGELKESAFTEIVKGK